MRKVNILLDDTFTLDDINKIRELYMLDMSNYMSILGYDLVRKYMTILYDESKITLDLEKKYNFKDLLKIKHDYNNNGTAY